MVKTYANNLNTKNNSVTMTKKIYKILPIHPPPPPSPIYARVSRGAAHQGQLVTQKLWEIYFITRKPTMIRSGWMSTHTIKLYTDSLSVRRNLSLLKSDAH